MVNELETRYMRGVISDLNRQESLYSPDLGIGFETTKDLAKKYFTLRAKEFVLEFLDTENPRFFDEAHFFFEELAEPILEYLKDEDIDPRAVVDIFEQNRRLILTGAPGSGKTTTLLYLSMLLAANYSRKTALDVQMLDLSLFESKNTSLAFEEYYVPVYIPLRELHIPESERLNLSINDLIAVRLATRLSKDEANRLARQLIDENRLWLILDGLDEMEAATRWVLLRNLSELLIEKDNLPITISSRTAGHLYKDLLKTDIENLFSYQIQPLGAETEVRAFATDWLKEKNIPKAGEEAEKLIRGANHGSGMHKIFRNPMFFRMLLYLYAENDYRLENLPETRFQLFEQYIRKIVSIEPGADRTKGVGDSVKMHLLEYIAWHLHSGSSAVPQKVVEENLGVFFPQVSELSTWIEKFTKEVNLLCAHSSGAGEQDGLLFAYRSFQEFFVARRLLAIWKKGRAGQRWAWQKVVAPNLGSFHYHEVLLFLFNELSTNSAAYKKLTHGKIFQEIWQDSSRAFKRDLFHEGIFDPILALKYKDVDLWIETVQTLGLSKGTGRDSFEMLLQLRNDEDDIVRDRAEEAIALVAGSIDAQTLLPLLKHNDYHVRAQTAEYIGEAGNLAARAALLPLLEDKDTYVRLMAAQALGSMGDPSSITALLPLLEDEDIFVQDAAIDALGQIGGEDAVEALLPLLGHEESLVRWYAAQALSKIGGADTFERILALLEDEAGSRIGVIKALREFGGPDAAQALEHLVEDGTWGVGHSALEALVYIKGPDAIPSIQPLTEADNYGTREYAAEMLGKIGGSAAQQILEDLLADPDARVKRSAVRALGMIGDESCVPALIPLLNHSYSYMRCAVAEALGEIGDQRAVQALGRRLEERDERVVLAAIKALGKIGGDDAVEALLPVLKHTDDAIPARAAEALGEIGTPNAVRALGTLVENPGPYAWEVAAYLLGEIGDTHAVNVLLLLLKEDAYWIHSRAAEALEKIGSPEVIQGLCELLEDKDVEVRNRAVDILSKIGNPTVGIALLAGLEDSNSTARQKAASALGKLRVSSAIPALRQMLDDKDSKVREAAVYALGNIGDRSIIPKIIQMLEDEDFFVQLGIVETLGKIKDPSAIPALLGLLEDENESLREDAVRALGEIGDPSTIPALLPLAHDINRSVRSSVVAVLEKMQYSPPLPELAELSRQARGAVVKFLALCLFVFIAIGIVLGAALAAPQRTCQGWAWLCASVNHYFPFAVAVMVFSGVAAAFLLHRFIKYRVL